MNRRPHRPFLSPPLRIDRVLLAGMLGAATLTGGMLVLGSLLPERPRSLALEQRDVKRIAAFLLPQPPKDVPDWLRKSLSAGDLGTAAGGRHIRESTRLHASRAPLAVTESATMAAKTATRSGILGIGSGKGRALSSIFREDTALGREAESALGGLVGTEVGDSFAASGSAGFGFGSIGSGRGGGSIGFYGSFGITLKRRPGSSPPPSDAGPRPFAPPPVQVAVRAGEWDDNANYQEFQRWLKSERYESYVSIDVSHRRFLVVRDANGLPVPRCRVEVRDSAGHVAMLRTGPSGRALLFPRAEGLRGTELSATARCSEGLVSQTFSAQASDAAVDLQLGAPRSLPQVLPVDIAFVLDTTGSMSEEIAAVKSTLRQVVARLAQERAQVRLALVEYKDRGDAFITRVHRFSRNAEAFSEELASVRAEGGGDTPEAVNEALHTAVSRLEWSDDAVGRFAFLIGDAPPHLDYEQDADYALAARGAAQRGIQIFTIAASGMDTLGQIVFRQIAQYTGGVNLFVLRGGVGPESSGAGHPRSSCRGTHENFTSGNLDALIISRVIRELRSVHADPLKIRGLRQDERARPCEQRFAARQ